VRSVGEREERPDWALDGSFLAFRKLPQLVPEFDKYAVISALYSQFSNKYLRFLVENAKTIEDDFPDAPNPADILGARFVGRWKSGMLSHTA
jgi:hypothetical protein